MIQSQCQNPRSYGNPMKMALSSSSSSPCSSSSSSAQQNQQQLQQQNQHQQSDNDRSSGELRALDCNLTSLCDHIQVEGFNSGAFSDVVVQAMGSTYRLHRLILSRSSYFRSISLLIPVKNPMLFVGVPFFSLAFCAFFC